jgi:S-formylglutathione hydrolase FrmB
MAGPAAAEQPQLHDGAGLTVASQRALDARLLTATVKTSALPGPANVRILLPRDYDPLSRTRYPVLYLIHGTSGGAPDWTVKGDAERATEGLGLIVVMPDIALNYDGGGWCTNWPNGPYRWETFHIDQLIPWVDANLRTRRGRGGRAIAGLSQGGFCSMSYAARHPDLFATAFSYSGAPDIAYDREAAVAATVVINGTEMGLDHVPPNSMFGDRVTNEINWRAHDPATLAENLRATRLFLYTGNGAPGRFDAVPGSLGGAPVEALVHEDTEYFVRRLDSLSIPNTYVDYGAGTHAWPYWARDLRWSIGPLMEGFADPPPRLRAITYTSADETYAVYGWTVATHRSAREFSSLEDASARGFALAGSGAATVTTPPVYRRGARYTVTLRGPHADEARTLAAAADRRLRIEVPLGPPNPYRQDTAQAAAAGMNVFTTEVRVRRARVA